MQADGVEMKAAVRRKELRRFDRLNEHNARIGRLTQWHQLPFHSPVASAVILRS
jgi:hypothetical protein